MTTFYICRHGQTENNKNRRLSGWIDTPLTDEGVKNTASSAAKLHSIRFDTVVSSDLGRAFVTAYLILKQLGYSNDIERFKGLREVNYGDFGNTPITSYPAHSALENTHYAPPGGESLAQMQQRVMSCIHTISLDNPGKTILLTGHDGTINALHASFANQDIGLVDSTSANAHDFVAKVVYDNGNGKIVSFDEIAG